jgi:hypothetical protein
MVDIMAIKQKMTPRKAIRQNCIDCVGSASDVRDCQGDELIGSPCLFYPYRMGKGRPSVRLIRKHCLWCMSGSQKLVRDCPSRKCPFLPYRLGYNPKMKARKPSDKQLKALLASRRMINRAKEPHCPVNSPPESMQNLIEGKSLHAISRGHDL